MFREDKATQMAAKFLKMAQGRLAYIHLLKMMYIADKEMLLKWGSPITFDRWYSMDKGPVLSRVLDLIRISEGTSVGDWCSHIQKASKYDVSLVSDPGDDALSRVEDEIIAETFRQWGNVDKWNVVEATHSFPEWSKPVISGSEEILYSKVLKVNGASDEEISAMQENLELQEAMQSLNQH